MRAPGLNAAGYSPLYDAAPQPSAWDTFISPIDHLESAKYLGAASMTPQAGSEQMPSSDYDLSPVPRPPSWETINRANGERSALFPDPPLSFWGAPARSLEGQQQTRGGSGTHESVPDILSDVTPDNHWIPGADYAGVGHHHNPRGVYGKFDLPKETRRVFDKAATGPLPFHGWHQFDELHRLYNAAIEDLMNRFMQEYNIKAPQMTPDHARSVLKAIADSDDPRIRVYRAMLQYMGRLYRLRTGVRGSE